MRAKEYMQQLHKLDLMIENKRLDVEQWKSIAECSSSPMGGGEKVQSSSKDQQKMATAICAYVVLEEQLEESITELSNKRLHIVAMIEQLPAEEYDVLHKIYIQGKSFMEVAQKYNKSYSWATAKHGRALLMLQKLIDKEADN